MNGATENGALKQTGEVRDTRVRGNPSTDVPRTRANEIPWRGIRGGGSSKALFPAERIILRVGVDHAEDRIGRRIVSSSERNHRVNCASLKILSHSRRAVHLAIVQRSLHPLVIFFVVSRRSFPLLPSKRERHGRRVSRPSIKTLINDPGTSEDIAEPSLRNRASSIEEKERNRKVGIKWRVWW